MLISYCGLTFLKSNPPMECSQRKFLFGLKNRCLPLRPLWCGFCVDFWFTIENCIDNVLIQKELCRRRSRAPTLLCCVYPQLALWARRISPASLAYIHVCSLFLSYRTLFMQQ